MSIEFLTRNIRRYLVGKEQDFTFYRANNFELPEIKKIDLYIHIPFCKNMCPYCPYNKVKYDKNLVLPFLNAILNEIDLYYEKLGKIEISSIYIGGGTPTNLIDELGIILKKVKDRFNVTGDICIETNPNDISRYVVKKLTEYGIDLVSLGVQSFNDKFLNLIGRNYSSHIVKPAIDLILQENFKSLNLDLMFALPGQKIEDILIDVKKAMRTGANQVTAYPLFTFPYSTIGAYLKIKNVKMPNIIMRRRMYRKIHNLFTDNEFQRVSVWGFKKENATRYSSVTRNNYIGLGPGAGSNVPGKYYLNTFSVSEYIKKCSQNVSPIALKMDFSNLMSSYHWFYWRLYDTYIPKKELYRIFGTKNKKISRILEIMKLFGLSFEKNGMIVLNERGSFWLHLMQNYFSLNYINKVWTIAQKVPWPLKIEI
ncbi:radical SAM protein [bacterium]|nr:radical SAM protein [bacterium]